MNKKWFFVLVPFIVVVLFMSCDLLGTPDYVGTWTATVGATSITMEFTRTTFSVTIDTIDPVAEYVLSGGLAESATASGLDATITSVALNGVVLDAAMMAAFLASYNLTEDETFTYVVTGESITVSGNLITALTGEPSITATMS